MASLWGIPVPPIYRAGERNLCMEVERKKGEKGARMVSLRNRCADGEEDASRAKNLHLDAYIALPRSKSEPDEKRKRKGRRSSPATHPRKKKKRHITRNADTLRSLIAL